MKLDSNKIKLGIAPIAWTNDDLPELGGENTFEQCVSEMALAGFTGSEVGNKYPRDVAVLKKALNLRGIQICNAWFSTFFTSQPFDYTLELFEKHTDFLQAMGAKMVGVAEQGNSIQGKPLAVFENKPVFTDEEWQKVAAGLEKLGEVAAKKGMRLSYHHHMGTGVQSAAEIDKLMTLTDPAKVSLLFDSGHCTFAGEDPLAILSKHIDRVTHIHLKDVRADILKRVHNESLSFLEAVKIGAFTVPGDGMIDFVPLFKVIADADYQGWMVVEAEQDPALANPLEYALMARDFIRKQTGL